MIADFGNLKRWHPLVERCEIDGQGQGAVRTVWFADSWAAERLERLDHERHSLHYAIIAGSNPSAIGLNGQISLMSETADKTQLTWTSGVDPTRTDAATLDAYLEHYYAERVEDLRKALKSSG